MSPEQQRVDPGAGEGRTARIVRYPNRRLYDRTRGRYVTLQEVVAMVREGVAVTVRDSKTNEDLTGTTLTQILLEFHPERVGVLPVPFLHLMIRANDAVLAFLREYLRQSLTYLEFWQRAAAFGPTAAPWEWMKAFLQAGPAAGGPPPPPPAGAEADVEALARRVEELERRLGAADVPPGKEETAPRQRDPAGPRPGRRSRPGPGPSGGGG